MKALSIRQLWAWLIVMGHKDVENRTWCTSFRSEFLIHAGKNFDHTGYMWVVSAMGLSIPQPHEFQRGGIVGVARLTDCVTSNDSLWFSGAYGFILSDARTLDFVPFVGKLRFFNVDVITI